MKIGVSCYPYQGGSGIIATELGISLAQQGHEVHFIASDMPVRLREVTENIFMHKVETIGYPLFETLPYTLSLAARMAEVAENFGLDMIHAHYALPHAASSYLASQMLAPRPLSTVTTLHGTDITLVGMHPSFYRVTKFCIEASHAVTAVSNYLRLRTMEIFRPRSEIQVIRNFVDTRRFAPASRPSGGAFPIVMHASNFRPVKRVETVIRVFHGIVAKVPAHLLLVGDGPERARAEDLVRDLGLSRQVHFLGSQVYMEELLPQARLFLLPSVFESFGLVALEAMSAGVPAIVTREGGAGELITHDQDGFLYSPDDLEGMVKMGIALLEDEGLSERIRRAARETAVSRFDTSLVVPEYLELYRRVMSRRADL